MCCFTAATPVTGLFAWLARRAVHVSATNIFARAVGGGRQVLAYSMNLATREPVAMVLPLPVVAGSGDDAVTFVNLAGSPRMFVELAELFDVDRQPGRKGGRSMPMQALKPTLVVHAVGSFVASYVPSRGDFERLDARFRLPAALFDAVPRYADYGFAVFQLAPGDVTVHPMALAFPTRDASRLFFPTVHVHDGRWHAHARFDHALYFQTPRAREPRPGDFEGSQVAWARASKDYAGLVDPKAPMLRRTLRGKLANDDTWLYA